jgi:hypothetical protein
VVQPTALPLWYGAAGESSGKQRPNAGLTLNQQRLPQPHQGRSGLACKKRSRSLKSSADGRPARESRRGSLIANVRRSILLMYWKPLKASLLPQARA